jgi:hypothetical protein
MSPLSSPYLLYVTMLSCSVPKLHPFSFTFFFFCGGDASGDGRVYFMNEVCTWACGCLLLRI